MITKIFIYLLLVTILPDLYIDWHYLRHKQNFKWQKRLSWWIPCLLMVLFTIKMAIVKNYIPNNHEWLDAYTLLFAILVLPKALFAICSIIGLTCRRIGLSKRNWGNLVGVILGLFQIYMAIYGFTIGFTKLTVTRIDLSFSDLPASFEGYKIVQFSDVHIGTFKGARQHFIERAVDSITSQKADMIVFTGDLENQQPAELYPFMDLLKKINAPDGVYSVLGNHDYSEYIDASKAIKVANERELIPRERQFGWTVLLNQYHAIYRNQDSILVAGEENGGLPPHPSLANTQKTLHGHAKNTFIVMLQHDPSAWRRDILPNSNVQLMLSGHTHGGQISIFGYHPITLKYPEDYGTYQEGDRMLHISSGLGALIPFRFGVPPEIVVITLHQKK